MAVYRIFLSPSNQVHNEGVNGYNEAQEMHRLAGRVKYYLDLSPMFKTKISDIKLGLDAVANDSNLYEADFHFAMHTDAGPVEAKGTTAFIYDTGGRGEKFAKILYSKIAALSPGCDRGIIVRPGLCELRKTNAPACLVENFFHTSPEEVAYYKANFDLIAEKTAQAFYEFYGVPYPDITSFKRIIQEKCGFTNPEKVWKLFDSFDFPGSLYQKLAEGLKKGDISGG